jgi:hypothetical protein
MKLSLGALAFVAAIAAALISSSPEQASATAHVCMDFPVSRVGPDCTARSPQKMGPCPVTGRTAHVNVFRPGETILVKLRETVNHPSHYRIAFNSDGESFPDPVSIDDTRPGHPLILVDGIEDHEDQVQEVRITFPRIPCENCTLQLMQVMYDKQANGFGGASGGTNDNDDLYYSCADIALRGSPVAAGTGEAPGNSRRFPGVLPIVAIGFLGLSAGGLRMAIRRGH